MNLNIYFLLSLYYYYYYYYYNIHLMNKRSSYTINVLNHFEMSAVYWKMFHVKRKNIKHFNTWVVYSV
jgi:hypothetical protein